MFTPFTTNLHCPWTVISKPIELHNNYLVRDLWTNWECFNSVVIPCLKSELQRQAGVLCVLFGRYFDPMSLTNELKVCDLCVAGTNWGLPYVNKMLYFWLNLRFVLCSNTLNLEMTQHKFCSMPIILYMLIGWHKIGVKFCVM